MSDQQATPYVRKRIALNNSKLSLSAPLPGAKNVYSTLSVDIYKNNPRIEVSTKDPNLQGKENDFGKIRAAMDTPMFFAFLAMLKEAIDSNNPMERRIENLNHTYEGGQRSQEIQLVSTLVVGRDQEGHVYVSVLPVKPGWPKIKFVFGVPDQRFHRFLNTDGSKPSRAEVSVIMASAYHSLWTQMVSQCLVMHYEDIPAGGGGGNWKKGGQGGGNWKGNGGGGYQQRQGGGGGGYQQRQGGGNGGGYQPRNEAPAPAGAEFSNDFADDGIPF